MVAAAGHGLRPAAPSPAQIQPLPHLAPPCPPQAVVRELDGLKKCLLRGFFARKAIACLAEMQAAGGPVLRGQRWVAGRGLQGRPCWRWAMPGAPNGRTDCRRRTPAGVRRLLPPSGTSVFIVVHVNRVLLPSHPPVGRMSCCMGGGAPPTTASWTASCSSAAAARRWVSRRPAWLQATVRRRSKQLTPVLRACCVGMARQLMT